MCIRKFHKSFSCFHNGNLVKLIAESLQNQINIGILIRAPYIVYGRFIYNFLFKTEEFLSINISYNKKGFNVQKSVVVGSFDPQTSVQPLQWILSLHWKHWRNLGGKDTW